MRPRHDPGPTTASGPPLNRRQLLLEAAALFTLLGMDAPTRALEAIRDQSPPPAADLTLESAERIDLGALVDTIIPRTDTPGAVDAGVPAFLARMLATWVGDEERSMFLQGLRTFSVRCLEKYGMPYAGLSAENQRIALGVEAEAACDQPHSFYRRLRYWTVIGYFTSEVGVRAHFDYQPMPAHFNPAEKVVLGARPWIYV